MPKRPTVPARMQKALYQEANSRCCCCREADVHKLLIHHIIPWAENLAHDPKHMLVLCANCHASATAGIISKEEIYSAKKGVGGIVPGHRSPAGDRPLSVSGNSPFPDLEKQMPELFAEMRKDLAEHPFAREFVILKKSWVFNADPNKTVLAYYFEDHPDLRNKLRILQNHRLIQEVTYNNTERFTMTEELVNHLMPQK